MDDKVTILFLAANPVDTDQIRYDKEIHDIFGTLNGAKERGRFRWLPGLALQLADLRRLLLEYRDCPLIVHFIGHGDSTAIYFEGQDGAKQKVDGAALSNIFATFTNVHCVVLNVCYSSKIAQALAEVIPCVVGMNAKPTDQQAIDFAVAFYDGIGAGLGCMESFHLARNYLDALWGLEVVQPVFFEKRIVDGSPNLKPNPEPELLAERFPIRGVSTGVFGIEETQLKLNIRPWKYDRRDSHPYLAAADQGLRVDFTDDEPYLVESILLEPPFDGSLPCGLAFGMPMTAAVDLLRNDFEVESTVGRLECLPRDDRHRNILIVLCPDDRVTSVAILERDT